MAVDNYLEDKYKLLMMEYYEKLKNSLESSTRRAQESCFVKIPFFDGKFDYKFGKDIMDFNMGLAEIESFCNKFYPPLSGQSPMNVNAVAYCIDSFTEDILEKVNKIFDGNIVVKCMELLAKEQGLGTACYLFFSCCLGLRVKILAIEMLYLAHMRDSVKVITVTHISTKGFVFYGITFDLCRFCTFLNSAQLAGWAKLKNLPSLHTIICRICISQM